MRVVGHRETRPPRAELPVCRPRGASKDQSEYAAERELKRDIADVTTCRKLFHEENLPIEDLVRRTGRDIDWVRQAVSYRIHGDLP